MAMDFTRASQRVRSMIAAKKPQELSRSTLTADDLRDNIIAENESHTARFKSTIQRKRTVEYEVTTTDEDGKETTEQREYSWTSFPDMMRDVARAGFSFDEPELRNANEVQPSRMLNRALMAETMISEGFQESRPYTRNNETEALYGAMAAAKSLEESAKTHLAEHIARSQEMEEQEGEIASADDMMNDLRKRARDQIDAAGQVEDQTKREIKGQVKRRQTAREALADLIQQQAQSSMIADAAAAARKAAAAGAEATSALSMLPGIGGGQAHNLSPDQQIELAEKWAANKTLRDIMALLGRMYRDMRFKREARTKNVPIEPVGITTGDDFSLMLPHELARGFSDNKLIKTTFVKDFVERNVLQYEMQGKMPAGKGPIICVTDGSGSMSGEKFVWAASVGVCLMMIAQREKRAFAGIEFGSANQMKSWYFPKDEPADTDAVLDYASHFFGGGTDTDTGMREALRICQQEPVFKSADVVIIGDGQDYFTADSTTMKHQFDELGVRIQGISILAPGCRHLEQWCENVVDILDMANTEEAIDAMATGLT